MERRSHFATCRTIAEPHLLLPPLPPKGEGASSEQPWSGIGVCSPWMPLNNVPTSWPKMSSDVKYKDSPKAGIEAATLRLTATRSADWATRALRVCQNWRHIEQHKTEASKTNQAEMTRYHKRIKHQNHARHIFQMTYWFECKPVVWTWNRKTSNRSRTSLRGDMSLKKDHTTYFFPTENNLSLGIFSTLERKMVQQNKESKYVWQDKISK